MAAPDFLPGLAARGADVALVAAGGDAIAYAELARRGAACPRGLTSRVTA